MILKLMGPEDCPDSDTRKTYRILDDVVACNFTRPDGDEAEPVVRVTFGNDSVESFPLYGNAYLMNQTGKTVSSFGCSPVPKAGEDGDPRIPGTPDAETADDAGVLPRSRLRLEMPPGAGTPRD